MRDISMIKAVARFSVRPAVFWVTASVIGNNTKQTTTFERVMSFYGTVVVGVALASVAQREIDKALKEVVILRAVPTEED